MGGAPGIGVVAPWVGARPDGDEPIAAVGPGEAAARAGEVGVKGSGVLVGGVGITASRIALPYLDQLPGNGTAIRAEQAPAQVDPLTLGFAGVPGGEVGILGTHLVGAEDRDPSRA